MKICFVGDAGSVHTQRWVGFFVAAGHEVSLISIRTEQPVSLQGVTHYWIDVRGPKIWRYLFALARVMYLLRTIAPDLVHAHYVTRYGCASALSGRHPFVLTAWGSDILIEPRRSWVARTMTKIALRRADFITCDAKHMVEAMCDLGAPRDKIEIIYFGTDVEKFHPRHRSPSLREELRFSADSLLVISTRSHRPVYDLPTLLHAIPLVIAEIPQARFVLAGDGPLRHELEELARSLSIADHVRFIGQKSEAELARLYATADVYVSTSLSDGGLAGSAAEAMASGIPVVLTHFGENAEWFDEGVGGRVVPARDIRGFAEAIAYFLRDGEKRRIAGIANRSTIERKNNFVVQMAHVEKTYRELCECKNLLHEIR